MIRVLGRRPEAGREVELVITEEQAARLVTHLFQQVKRASAVGAQRWMMEVALVVDQRLREATGPGGAVESSTRTGEQEGH